MRLENDALNALFNNIKVNVDGVDIDPKASHDGSSYDSYGDLVAEDIWVVYEVNGELWKQWGYVDSYGSRYWDGGLSRVEAKKKTVEVYE